MTMTIAVLSGKGGTGKTLVSVNLAAVAQEVTLLDCDVEEPNDHLFFAREDQTTESIHVLIPKINHDLCNGCRACVDFCRFNALAYVGGKVKLFDEICHSCGGCERVCAPRAITEVPKTIGKIISAKDRAVQIHSGMLNIGEASGIPIIKALLQKEHGSLRVIDCPPGSACIVMESIKQADYCILVAEPTLFGVHNLNMVYALVRLFGKPFGVVINKCLDQDDPAESFCKDHGISILARIPYDSVLGHLSAEGGIMAKENKAYDRLFSDLLENVRQEVGHETAPGT